MHALIVCRLEWQGVRRRRTGAPFLHLRHFFEAFHGVPGECGTWTKFLSGGAAPLLSSAVFLTVILAVSLVHFVRHYHLSLGFFFPIWAPCLALQVFCAVAAWGGCLPLLCFAVFVCGSAIVIWVMRPRTVQQHTNALWHQL